MRILKYYENESRTFVHNFTFIARAKQSGTLHVASLLFSIFHNASSMRKYMLIKFRFLIKEAL